MSIHALQTHAPAFGWCGYHAHGASSARVMAPCTVEAKADGEGSFARQPKLDRNGTRPGVLT
ncbi:MAG: hypothetical protein KBG48_32910 [Kofleriaceae bacterium]|jgi:hypothetical protein|nr:hypothetical protein [Kofleriaceae bacterium]MBP9172210.1 hypothetical protein [Kofleriaceae bacterium]MBP9861370.1 hypothetical protein [Kofleriaceae bacterium]